MPCLESSAREDETADSGSSKEENVILRVHVVGKILFMGCRSLRTRTSIPQGVMLLIYEIHPLYHLRSAWMSVFRFEMLDGEAMKSFSGDTFSTRGCGVYSAEILLLVTLSQILIFYTSQKLCMRRVPTTYHTPLI
jgi:hypothetical protein